MHSPFCSTSSLALLQVRQQHWMNTWTEVIGIFHTHQLLIPRRRAGDQTSFEILVWMVGLAIGLWFEY